MVQIYSLGYMKGDPKESIIKPKWLMVEYARIRFKSVATNAIVDAISAVTKPTIATTTKGSAS